MLIRPSSPPKTWSPRMSSDILLTHEHDCTRVGPQPSSGSAVEKERSKDAVGTRRARARARSVDMDLSTLTLSPAPQQRMHKHTYSGVLPLGGFVLVLVRTYRGSTVVCYRERSAERSISVGRYGSSGLCPLEEPRESRRQPAGARSLKEAYGHYNGRGVRGTGKYPVSGPDPHLCSRIGGDIRRYHSNFGNHHTLHRVCIPTVHTVHTVHTFISDHRITIHLAVHRLNFQGSATTAHSPFRHRPPARASRVESRDS
ncbi:hypothetical protein BZA05DRAFT_98390 [Tricharina praecox]|uniref:uncharacterized protein n=1 Tax=Tricharina praecox TaxID=43433 RepID=UPI00221F8B52|nr:uncharacterized protein BZA05DRAFT_98390 [Tricharina praecox]KAI5857520.1 hypothetical protein BZA05DRAFT_98390 [Tricharina praecox]